MDKGKPEAGKVYSLTGGTGTPSIASGNTLSESEVKEKTFRVTSFEQVVYEQIVEAKDEDQAVKKACEAGDWGNAESGEVISQEAEEIDGN